MSKSKSVSQLWQQEAPRLLGWAELADPVLIGIMARAGYDAVLLDWQHGLHDYASCVACINEAKITDTPVLVRVPVGEFAQAARMLDLGATGVVAPMINSAAEAEAFASYVKFPPFGTRSFGPSRAMQLLNMDSSQDFLSTANEQTLALVMIETKAGVEALGAILGVPGIDGILVGPGDLSVALSGGTFDPDGEQTRKTMLQILDKTREAGKLACAFAGTPQYARANADAGYHVVSVGYDFNIVSQAFADAIAEMKGAGCNKGK